MAGFLSLLPRALLVAAALALSGCAMSVHNRASNEPASADSPSMRVVRDLSGTNAIALSFSGGGLRAAAFSQGVLQGLSEMSTEDGDLLDDIAYIGSVSGGSITAAYYGLHGREGLASFREQVLLQDLERDLRISPLLPWNLARLLGGGLNAHEDFAEGLDRRVFHGATFADIYRRPRPDIRIHATDLYHRVAFPFTPQAFGLICSDILSYSVADAVAASMAVPVVFAPIVLRTYPGHCREPLPPTLARIRFDADSPLLAQATEAAVRAYREEGPDTYIKLADGGLSDNFGLSTIEVSRLVRGVPYAPLSEHDAVVIQRLLFIVVDASRGPGGDWNASEAGPTGFALAIAAGDAAIDATARLAADSFRHSIRELEQSIVAWRCGLTREEALSKGAPADWHCDDVKFSLAFLSADRLDDAELRQAFAQIPTRLTLPEEQVDLALQSGRAAVLASPRVHRYLRDRVRSNEGL